MEDKKTNKPHNYVFVIFLCYIVMTLIVPVIGKGKKYTFEEGAVGQIGQSVYFGNEISKGTIELTGAVKTEEMELDDYFIEIADKDTVFFTNRLMNIMQCERNGYIVFSVKTPDGTVPDGSSLSVIRQKKYSELDEQEAYMCYWVQCDGIEKGRSYILDCSIGFSRTIFSILEKNNAASAKMEFTAPEDGVICLIVRAECTQTPDVLMTIYFAVLILLFVVQTGNTLFAP